jgi:hypothetical protein
MVYHGFEGIAMGVDFLFKNVTNDSDLFDADFTSASDFFGTKPSECF